MLTAATAAAAEVRPSMREVSHDYCVNYHLSHGKPTQRTSQVLYGSVAVVLNGRGMTCIDRSCCKLLLQATTVFCSVYLCLHTTAGFLEVPLLRRCSNSQQNDRQSGIYDVTGPENRMSDVISGRWASGSS